MTTETHSRLGALEALAESITSAASTARTVTDPNVAAFYLASGPLADPNVLAQLPLVAELIAAVNDREQSGHNPATLTVWRDAGILNR